MTDRGGKGRAAGPARSGCPFRGVADRPGAAGRRRPESDNMTDTPELIMTSSSCDGGRGREIASPCRMSQPSSISIRRARESSTPSPTTLRPRRCPRSRTERTIATSGRLPCASDTNPLSIFTSSNGSALRISIELYPVPKSSSDNLTPCVRSSRSMAAARVGWVTRALSVISRVRTSAGSPCLASVSDTSVGRSPRTSMRADRFTDTGTWCPADAQSAHCRSASSNTHSVTSMISVDRSAIGRKAAGASSPRVGCAQRKSASTPAIRPVRADSSGW